MEEENFKIAANEIMNADFFILYTGGKQEKKKLFSLSKINQKKKKFF